ncbi:MAG: 3-dehydroquinate synthase [Phycisphaerae bacterium]
MPRKMMDYQTYNQRFSVPFDYPVHFTRDLFAPDSPLLAEVVDRKGESRRHRCVVYVDAGAAAAHPRLVARIKEYFHAYPRRLELAGAVELVPGGEAAKTGWGRVRDVMWAIGNLHLDRQSFVIAVGGGGVLDMVGFGTSIVHRGLRFVRVPTTTLAQADAGVGVKNGMDEHGMKNFVGTFAPPFAVINDFAFLPTLAQEDWIGGVAEAFKVAIIKDAALLGFLCANADAFRRRDQAAMEQVVYRTAVLHLDHIRTTGDPFEFGSARPLDFGHWAAHKIEAMTGFRIGHGQAVAVGVAMDSFYAMRHGLLAETDLAGILDAMLACGLPIWLDELDRRTADGPLEVLDGLEQFREHLGGSLTVTLPKGVGAKCEVHQMNIETIEEAVCFLKGKSRQIPRREEGKRG